MEWTEKEWNRFDARVEKMMKAGLLYDENGNEHEGIDIDEAQEAARALLERDRDPHDDRRVCFECANLDGRFCTAAIMRNTRSKFEPVRIILQRCEGFELRGKK